MSAEMADALRRLGAKRVEAELLAALMAHDALGTKDLLEQTGLRQPEVSVGMQVLRARGWVEAEPIPREGKGRPMHRYALAIKKSELRNHWSQEGEAAIKEIKDAVARLKKA